MEYISHTLKVALPNYLQSLPIPSSFDELGKLSGSDWLSLAPVTCILLVVFYSLGSSVRNLVAGKGVICNPAIRKSEAKITDVIIREELDDKVSFCRCWRSSKWPYCDGAHKHHNRATGDNVGALVIRSKDWKPKPKDKDKHKS